MTTSYLLWLGIGLSTQIGIGFRFPWLVGTGRLFSRPLWRFRFFRPFIFEIEGDYYVSALRTRFAQFAVMVAALFAAAFTIGGPMNEIFWLIIVLLYLDDYFTGNDERWKRYKRQLRRLFPKARKAAVEHG